MNGMFCLSSVFLLLLFCPLVKGVFTATGQHSSLVSKEQGPDAQLSGSDAKLSIHVTVWVRILARICVGIDTVYFKKDYTYMRNVMKCAFADNRYRSSWVTQSC